MKKLFFILTLSIVLSQAVFAIEKEISLTTKDGKLYGTMLYPTVPNQKLAVLFISGSGPTDRNGNNPQMVNNSIKYLAQSLCKEANIASLRYDKRGIVESVDAGLPEQELRFSTYVEDANAWVEKLHKEYDRVVIIGHSEGALIATMVARQNKNVGALVLLAGAGRTADVLLKEQLSNATVVDKYFTYTIIDRLKNGEEVNDIPQAYRSLFRKTVQPYLISWFAIDPCQELSCVEVPTLIVQGDTDIQIKVDDAKLLHKAKPNAQIEIIQNMNHVLKTCESRELSQQLPTYSSPNLQNNPQLTSVVVKFLKQLPQ